jgi:hypothetical protein
VSALMTYVKTNKLAPAIQTALRQACFTKPDVRIEARTHVCIRGAAGQGQRALASLVEDMHDVNTVTTHVGSYGGANPFTSRGDWDPDWDDTAKLVPVNGAIVTGTQGGYVTVTVHPLTLARMIAPTSYDTMVASDAAIDGNLTQAATIAHTAIEAALSATQLTEEECYTLYTYGALKSGEYRQRALRGLSHVVENLIARGMLRRAANGATQITTLGKACRAQWQSARFDRS